jgi:hypothetical protein
MQQHVSEVCAAFIGLDWADATHDVGLQAAGTAQREFLRLAQSPEALRNWPTINSRFKYIQEQRGSSTWGGNRQRRFS